MKNRCLTIMLLLMAATAFAGENIIGGGFFDPGVGSSGIERSDDFTGENGSEPNAERWWQWDPNSCLSIQNNKLRKNYTGVGPDNGYLLSNWTFGANEAFDIRLDFDIITFGDPDVTRVSQARLAAYIQEDPWSMFMVGYRKVGGAPDYTEYFVDSNLGPITYSAVATSGKFRLTRDVAGNWKAYVWENSQWEWNGNTAGYSFVDTYSGGGLFVDLLPGVALNTGGHTVTIDFDNFEVVGE